VGTRPAESVLPNLSTTAVVPGSWAYEQRGQPNEEAEAAEKEVRGTKTLYLSPYVRYVKIEVGKWGQKKFSFVVDSADVRKSWYPDMRFIRPGIPS